MESPVKIAVLDDYQHAALDMADWSALKASAEVMVFSDHLAEPDELVARLSRFDVVCIMRERTPLPRALLERLPKLRLIVSTGPRNASLDVAAAKDLGIEVANTGYFSSPTIELTWALILASARGLVAEANAVRNGSWQQGVGFDLRGKTLGVLGLGNVGGEVARIGQAFGMNVIAWSENLTAEKAEAGGARRVEKRELFEQSDFLSIHVVLSKRTRGLVDAEAIAQMKPTAHLINTSRGPIVDETALLEALRAHRLAGAALDVFDVEPLPPEHPYRTTDRLLATPHIGYVSQDLYQTFYRDTVAAITAWLANHETGGAPTQKK